MQVQTDVQTRVSVGKYNPRSLVVLLLNKKTREVVMEEQIHIGKRNLNSLCKQKNANHTVAKLNRYGFCEYNEPGNEYIIRYELTE